MSRLLPLIAALSAACAGGDASTPDDGPRASEIPAFDAERAWKHLEAQVAIGPRHAGSEGAERTRKYLEEHLEAAGLTPVREAFTSVTPVGSIEFCNVYADLPGTGGDEQPIFVIASHYDTKRLGPNFVGANDGGSSTAVLLELARVVAAGPQRPVTYRFLFLDGEEAVRDQWRDPDNRYGSKYHVQRIKKQGLDTRVKICVLLDMVGDKDLKLTLDQNSDQDLVELFERTAKQNDLGRYVWSARMPILDDHISFSEGLSIPVIDLIDFQYGPSRATWWHTDEDSLDKCSAASLGVSGKLVIAALPELEETYGKKSAGARRR